MIKKRIVQLSNEKYAIQIYFLIPFFNLGFEDLTGYHGRWKRGSPHFKDCLGTLEEVKDYHCKEGHGLKITKIIEVDCNEHNRT